MFIRGRLALAEDPPGAAGKVLAADPAAGVLVPGVLVVPVPDVTVADVVTVPGVMVPPAVVADCPNVAV